MADTAESSVWTCARCSMRASWMPEVGDLGMPSGWIEEDGLHYCVSCRRELAAETAEASTPADADPDQRRIAGQAARIEFEVKRDPNRADTRIARTCRSSVTSVRKVRERLGAYPTSPA